VNPGALSAFFVQHKVALMGAGAAGAVLLGLRSRQQRAAAGTSAAPKVTPGTAAAVVPANGLQGVGSTYDSSAYDVYSALQQELGPFLQQQAAQTGSSSGISTVPPIASTLFAPSGSGNYVAYKNGTIAEIESDGSQLGLIDDEWRRLAAGGATYKSLGTDLTSGQYFETATNLANVGQGPASALAADKQARAAAAASNVKFG
jgi:hypothetical protein